MILLLIWQICLTLVSVNVFPCNLFYILGEISLPLLFSWHLKYVVVLKNTYF